MVNWNINQLKISKWKHRQRKRKRYFSFFFNNIICYSSSGASSWLSRKESACNAGDAGDVSPIPGWGAFPGGEQDNPLQYSYWESPIDQGPWWAKVHEVAKCQTRLKRLSTNVCTLQLNYC